MFVSSLNFVGLTEKRDKNCFGIWEKENWRNKGINKHQQPDSSNTWCTWYINLLSMCGPSFSFVGLSVSEKREMKLFDIWKLDRKKNEEIKGRICRRSLVLCYIKQQMIHNIFTKLQNSLCNSSWEIFVTNFPLYITLEWEMEKGKKKAK